MRQEWQNAPLGALCTVCAGGTPSRAKPEFWDGDIPWVKISDMLQGTITTTDENISRLGLENSAAKVLPAGTLLLSIFATIGRTAVLGIEAATNQAIVGLTMRDACRLEPNFLRRFLEVKSTELAQRARGVAQSNINASILKALTVPLPPILEQRKIAQLLDLADALRAKRRAALAQLDSLTQSLFLDLFGQQANSARIFPQVRLSEVTTRITDGTHLTPKFIGHGVPFIFVKNVRNGGIDFQTDKFISEQEHLSLYKRCPIEPGDVLYTIVGATYGHAASVGAFTKFAFQRHLAHLKPDTKKVVPEFLGTVMQLPLIKRQADRWARGVAQPTINLKELREFVIPLPPLSLQREFSRRVAAVEQLKTAHRASLAELDALFASLQHRAFRGEL